MTATADKEKFILGTKDNSLLLNVDIKNRGEDAFESKLYVDIPQGFEFGGVVVPEGKVPYTYRLIIIDVSVDSSVVLSHVG